MPLLRECSSTEEPLGPPRHYHEQLTELFYILQRELVFLIGAELYTLPAGATGVIPPGTVPAFRTAEHRQARLLIMVVPGGFEGFFDDAQGLRSPMSDAARWRQIKERWDTHVVGPPLER